MTYVCMIISPVDLYGVQIEVLEKDAILCAQEYGKREKGENVRVVDAWTGKTLSEVTFDGEKYVKPSKKRNENAETALFSAPRRKPAKRRAAAAKAPIYEQTSLF